jgi:hypothetical protein
LLSHRAIILFLWALYSQKKEQIVNLFLFAQPRLDFVEYLGVIPAARLRKDDVLTLLEWRVPWSHRTLHDS